MVGEEEVYDDCSRKFFAIATEDSLLLVVNGSDFIKIAKNYEIINKDIEEVKNRKS